MIIMLNMVLNTISIRLTATADAIPQRVQNDTP